MATSIFITRVASSDIHSLAKRTGQVVVINSNNEVFIDIDNGSRIFLGDCNKYETEEARIAATPADNTFATVSTTSNKMYYYNTGWIVLNTLESVLANFTNYTVLTPHTLSADGKSIAPKTLMSCVYNERGETVNDEIARMDSKIDNAVMGQRYWLETGYSDIESETDPQTYHGRSAKCIAANGSVSKHVFTSGQLNIPNAYYTFVFRVRSNAVLESEIGDASLRLTASTCCGGITNSSIQQIFLKDFESADYYYIFKTTIDFNYLTFGQVPGAANNYVTINIDLLRNASRPAGDLIINFDYAILKYGDDSEIQTAPPVSVDRISIADTLTTPRLIALSGAVTGSGYFDGSSNLNIVTSVDALSETTSGTYYIDYEYGDDLNDGITEITPFKTFRGFAARYNKLQYANIILLSNYTEDIQINEGWHITKDSEGEFTDTTITTYLQGISISASRRTVTGQMRLYNLQTVHFDGVTIDAANVNITDTGPNSAALYLSCCANINMKICNISAPANSGNIMGCCIYADNSSGIISDSIFPNNKYILKAYNNSTISIDNIQNEAMSFSYSGTTYEVAFAIDSKVSIDAAYVCTNNLYEAYTSLISVAGKIVSGVGGIPTIGEMYNGKLVIARGAGDSQTMETVNAAPINAGGTGAVNAVDARTNLGIDAAIGDAIDVAVADITAQLTTKADAATLIAHTEDAANPHGVTKAQVGLGDVPNVSTNDQTPTYTVATNNTELVSGETVATAFGKIAKAIKSLITHITSNVLHITAEERADWNSKATEADITTAVSTKADISTLTSHMNDTAVHVTSTDKAAWDAKATVADVATAVSTKANSADLTAHTGDTDIHITSAERVAWDAKVNTDDFNTFSTTVNTALTNKASSADLTTHTNDNIIHVTSVEKTEWNSKANAADLATKANATDLTTHTDDTDIHVSAADRAKWDSGSSTEIEAHIANTIVHTTAAEKAAWDAKASASDLDAKADISALSDHTENSNVHVTSTEKAAWDAKLDTSALDAYLKKDGSAAMTNALIIGTTNTTVYTGVQTIRKTSSSGTREAGFFVNSDGTSKFVNRLLSGSTFNDTASLIFNENVFRYMIGTDSYDIYTTHNLTTATTDTTGLMSTEDKTKIDSGESRKIIDDNYKASLPVGTTSISAGTLLIRDENNSLWRTLTDASSCVGVSAIGITESDIEDFSNSAKVTVMGTVACNDIIIYDSELYLNGTLEPVFAGAYYFKPTGTITGTLVPGNSYCRIGVGFQDDDTSKLIMDGRIEIFTLDSEGKISALNGKSLAGSGGGGGGVVVQDTAPDNTSMLWIDSSDDNIAKYYDATSSSWVAIPTTWG